MNDPEKPIRDTICRMLASCGRCEQHVTIGCRDGTRRQVDVLCTPHDDLDDGVDAYPFAIEAKSKTVIGDAYLAPWIIQAHRYVGGHRYADPDSPKIAACFLWLVGTTWKAGEADTMDKMLMLGQHLQVGRAWIDDERLALCFTGGMGTVWHSSTGWGRQAVELLRRPPIWV